MRKGFTLAEALITLVIIGVVSALVIPSVLKNYNEKKYDTARLKALKTFGEAGKMASINEEMNSQTNAKDFVNNVLSKYLKIVKVCDTLEECNFPSQIQPLNPNASKITINNRSNGWPYYWVNWSFIKTADGFSAAIKYNPECVRNSRETHKMRFSTSVCNSKECSGYNSDIICMTALYDMNGTKGPNQFGKDVGLVATFWSGSSANSVAPGMLSYEKMEKLFGENGRTPSKTYQETRNICSNLGKEYSMPNVDEISLLYAYTGFTSMPYGFYWTGSTVQGSSNQIWCVGFSMNERHPYSNNGSHNVWCVKR